MTDNYGQVNTKGGNREKEQRGRRREKREKR